MDCKNCGYKGTKNQCVNCPPCPRCGDKKVILIDISDSYGNRKERRAAKRAGLPMQKWVPCPDCSKEAKP